MAPPTPKRNPPAKKKPKAKPKASSMLDYVNALDVSPSTKKDGKGNSVIPRGALTRDAPETAMGRYVNGLVAPRDRLRREPGFGPGGTTPGSASGPKVPSVGGSGGWFQNLGKDAMSIVTGLPGTLALAGRVAASPATGAYGLTGLPGAGASRGATADAYKDLWEGGKAAVTDIKDRWGPFVEAGSLIDLIRDPDRFGNKTMEGVGKIKEHPGFAALDVAAAFSGGQTAMVRGSQLAVRAGESMATKRGGHNAFPENTPPPRASGQSPRNPRLQQTGPTEPRRASGLERRLLDPKVREMASSRQLARRRNMRTLQLAVANVSDGVKAVAYERPTNTVRRRNLAANPGTRALQQGIQNLSDQVLEGLGNRAEKRGATKMGDKQLARFSTRARDDRFIQRDARRDKRNIEDKRDEDLHKGLETEIAFTRNVLYKREISKDPRKEALVNLRVDNIAVARKGDSRKPSERLAEAIRLAEAENAKKEAAGFEPKSLEASRKNIELYKSIPAEMVDNPSPAILEAEKFSRAVLKRSQDIRERTGGIHGIRGATRQRAGAYREAIAVHGAKFYDDVGSIMHPERREDLVKTKGYQHVDPKQITKALRQIYNADTRPAPGLAQDVARELIAEGRMPTPGTAAAAQLSEGGSMFIALSKALNSKYGEDGIPLKADGDIDSKLVAERIASGNKALEALLNDPANLFPRGMTPDLDGEYRDSLVVGLAAGHKNAGALDGLGEAKSANRQTTGARFRNFGDSTSRETIAKTLQSTLNAFWTKKSVQQTLDKWALRAPGSDKPHLFSTGAALDQLDAEVWTLVDVRSLEHLVEELNVTDPDMRRGTLTAFDDPAEIRKLLESGKGMVAALPTAMIKEIKHAVDDPSGMLKRYDTAMAMWRAGILAYTPRWFVNNLLGTSVFLGVMSGMDLRAFRQASRDSRFYMEGAVPHRAESVSHSSDIGRADEGRGGLEPQSTSRFMRGAHVMFQLNQRLEGRLRRTAYISRAKQNMRVEGHTRRGKLTDDELFDAITSMPEDLKMQTLDDMEFFVGQYKTLSTAGQRTMRRVIPFWSWMRVINTWAFGMPFKSPIRAEAVRLGTTMAEAIGEDTEGLPLWEKGRLLFGEYGLRTNNVNPLFSVAEEIAGVTDARGPGEAFTSLVRVGAGSAAPPIQVLFGLVSGRNPFGTRDYTAPTGSNGTLASFGSNEKRRNRVTGEIEDVHQSPSILNSIVDQMVPGGSVARQALQGNDQAYDTAGTLDLLRARLGLKDPKDVFAPPPVRESGRSRLPYGLGTLAAVSGAPLYKVDRETELATNKIKELRFIEAGWDTQREMMKEQIMRGLENGR